MDLLKSLLEAKGGDLVRQLAGQAGIDEQQAGSAMAAMLPSLATGMRANLAKPGGLESLLGALSSGRHQQYVENPELVTSAAAVEDGNGILGHLLGSKDVSRQVAAQAAQRSGVDVEKLKGLLPMLAAAMMGTVSKTTAELAPPSTGGGLGGMLGGLTGALGGGGDKSVIGGLFSKMLDSDGDGDVDLGDIAGRFLNR